MKKTILILVTLNQLAHSFGELDLQFIAREKYVAYECNRHESVACVFPTIQEYTFSSKKLCEEGLKKNCNNYGVSLAEGTGIRQNYKEAEKFLQESTINNDGISYFNLGLLYTKKNRYNQDNIDVNTIKEFFGKSCDQGFEPGCKNYQSLNND